MTGPSEALLVIDMQLGFDDPSWGRRNNPGAETQALRLIAHARRTERLVVFIRHDSSDAASPLSRGHPGNRLKPGFEFQDCDWLIAKQVNSAFIGTGLETRLREAGIGQLTILGLTTDQCVSTTARMASNLGFATTVAEDACACFEQTSFDGRKIPAEMMHLAHMTTLHSEFGRVARVAELLAA